MIIHQLVEGVELYNPQEVFSCTITQHLKVLHIIAKPAGTRERFLNIVLNQLYVRHIDDYHYQ